MKMTVIGAGNVGATTAQRLADKQLATEVVLLDIAEGIPQGKGLDMYESMPVEASDCRIVGTNSYADTADSEIVVITAGLARKPGMSRDDLVKTNAEIVRNVAKGIRENAPEAFVIVVTNPLDAMVYLMQKETGFAANRVVGMAGVLDTARYQAFLADELNVSVASVSAFVLGGHGDDMVPVRSFTTCNGVPVGNLIKADRLDAIEKRVRGAGGEVVALLKNGSAFYSPAASAIQMVESYLFDQRRVLAAAAKLNGEYGLKDLYIGVPVIIGRGGIEKVVEIELAEAERTALHESAERVKALLAIL